MSNKKKQELGPNHLKELEQAQNERIEEMFEELKDCNIGFLSEISSKNNLEQA